MHQYALEPIFHVRVMKHPCRVHDSNEAKLFYVPFYGGLEVLRWNFTNASNDIKDLLAIDLLRWLETQGPWFKNLGKDHVFVLGKISWDFRRNDKSSWGTRLLELDEMQNPIKLLIERQPWHVNNVGIPHPIYFHPHTDDDIIAWQIKLSKIKRTNVASFLAPLGPVSELHVRPIDRPDSIMELFMESEFCLQPPGDSPTRKSVFDSLISWCIPVLFDPMTAYNQYPWRLPKIQESIRFSLTKKRWETGV
ncbi:root hair specific 8 [Perilla frutescens var. hirtella]|nr:root hair specific 8 [Perilla frutescens var. hirtella]